MATAEAVIKLPTIARSPSTIQYQLPRPTASGRPNYIRRFYPNDEAKATLSQPWLRKTDPMMPPYPYGKNVHFEEANHGLYGGKTIQTGNKISDGRNKGKTLRKWYPNVRVERLKSNALGVEMSIPTVARVMRTIQKCGGLDEYLLGEKPARIKELGLLGWKLRWLVMKSDTMKRKHTKERSELGLKNSTDPFAQFSTVWEDPEIRDGLIEKMHSGWLQLQEKDTKFKRHFRSRRVGHIKTLDMYDPKELPLPEQVIEGHIRVPRVRTGFGLIDMPRSKPVSALPIPAQLAVDKKPGAKKGALYKGGEGSAVSSRRMPLSKSGHRETKEIVVQ